MSISCVQQIFQIKDIAANIFSFINPKELAISNCINRTLRKISDSQNCWKFRYEMTLRPQDGASVDYRRIIKEWYANIFGKSFYFAHIKGLKSIGEVPPIPEIYNPKEGFRLILIPRELEIEIEANSPISLNENGQLIESSLSNESRILKVPMTLNNIEFLTKKCLKEGHPIGFKPESFFNVFKEHGNTPVKKSYWSYQKEELIGYGLSDNEQFSFAKENGFMILPLIDRVSFNLFMHIRSGHFPDGPQRFARTETSTTGMDGNFSRSLCGYFDFNGLMIDAINLQARRIDIGAAVGMPRES